MYSLIVILVSAWVSFDPFVALSLSWGANDNDVSKLKGILHQGDSSDPVGRSRVTQLSQSLAVEAISCHQGCDNIDGMFV